MSAGRTCTQASFPIFGCVAAWMSFVVNKSIGWAIVHFIFGFFYVCYASCVYPDELGAAIENVSK